MKIQDEIKSEFVSEYHKARVNIHFTNIFLSNELIAILKPYELSITQFNVLRILRGQLPNAVSIGLIRERMLDKSSDVSRIIDRMLLKKLVARSECKVDRRQKDVKISDMGLDVLKEIDKHADSLEQTMKALTEEEVTALNNILDKIRS